MQLGEKEGIRVDGDTSAWTFGGSILTFAFPMLLFIVVAVALYIVYTKPQLVPGHRPPTDERPVSYTAMPGKPAQTQPAQTQPAQAKPEGGE